MTTSSPEQHGLARRLAIALAIPIVILFTTGVVLGVQLLRMVDDARWVEHTDRVIANAQRTLVQVADQEIAIKSYLLSRDRTFLAPYDRANPEETFSHLHDLIADNPTQQERVRRSLTAYRTWKELCEPILRGENLEAQATYSALSARRRAAESFREEMRMFVANEQDLLRIRAEASDRSYKVTSYVFVGLILLAALVLAFLSTRQLSSIAATFSDALKKETDARTKLEKEGWVRTGQAKLSEALQGEQTIDELSRNVLTTLSAYVGAEVGALFSAEGSEWRRSASIGLAGENPGNSRFALNEGLVGRAATEGRVLTVRDVPPDHFAIASGTGTSAPTELLLVPARADGVTAAVIELGFLSKHRPEVSDLFARIGESVALAFRGSHYKRQLVDLLEEAQRNAEELQTQQEELRVANEELQEQSAAMREAQVQLEERQHELETTNARLEEQKEELAASRAQIAAKSAEVEKASRYKSEFLANMSHELRTPLNSALILAKLLSENKQENLTPEQVKFAETIYEAGNDLLTLISDILDLSKVEAGKMEVKVSRVDLESVVTSMARTFEPMASEKGISFNTAIMVDDTRLIQSDLQKVEQVLRNLLSNAIKFTEHGGVTLTIEKHSKGIAFVVKDTGIGISPADHALIFEAFRQVDSGATRKYGGTGLGLSISREFARLLGGELTVSSERGEGSTFVFSLPLSFSGPTKTTDTPMQRSVSLPPPAPKLRTTNPLNDDLDKLDGAHRLVLIVEDDDPFGGVLLGLAHELGFQCVIAQRADEGFFLAKRHQPSAIILDIGLPDHSGLSVLDRLKRDPATRHIPVHVVSGADHAQTALEMGAIGYLIKPASREQLIEAFQALEKRFSTRLRRVLVVEDDQIQRDSLRHLLEGPDVEIVAVGGVEAGLQAIRDQSVDCVVTDLTLQGESGLDLLEKLAADESFAFPPVIVYTGRSLSEPEEQRLRRYSNSIIIKGARSPERLLDEVTLFLHQVEAELPQERQRMLRQSRDREQIFQGRHILVVEDDVRNIFALSSVLEPKGVKISIARNGREAINVLSKDPTIDLVLMDIMMPEMDGYEATREIRKKSQWAKLPIVALTAKAMKDDQMRCLEAGANDYIAKPLDVDMLLSLLRVWMPKR